MFENCSHSSSRSAALRTVLIAAVFLLEGKLILAAAVDIKVVDDDPFVVIAVIAVSDYQRTGVGDEGRLFWRFL